MFEDGLFEKCMDFLKLQRISSDRFIKKWFERDGHIWFANIWFKKYLNESKNQINLRKRKRSDLNSNASDTSSNAWASSLLPAKHLKKHPR